MYASRRGTTVLALILLVNSALGCGAGNEPNEMLDAGVRQTIFGGDRPTEILVPREYDHAQPTPLVVVLHGLGATGIIQAAYSGLAQLPDQRGAIVVAPDGTKLSDNRQFWNATDVCCDFESSGVDDSGYIARLVSEISAVWNVDPKRVFLFGHSNGGFMSYRLACDHADVFAALVSLAGATFLNVSDCTPSEPVSVLQIHGDADNTVPYLGGLGVPSAEDTVSTWASYNNCGPLSPTSERLDLESSLEGTESSVARATDCESGSTSELWRIEAGGHIPALATDFHEQVFDWLNAHAK